MIFKWWHVSLLCVVVSVAGALLVYSHHIHKINTKNEFTIRTNELAFLPPHEHVLGRDSVTDDGHHEELNAKFVAPKDMWITGMRFEIVNAPAIVLHHASLYRSDVPNLECPSHFMRPLLVISQDQEHNPEASFPEGYGIFVPEGTPLYLDGMFHNPEVPLGPGETYKNVFLEVSLTLAEENEIPALKPLSFHLLSLSEDPCGFFGHTFVVPPSAKEYSFAGVGGSKDSSKLRINTPSRILYWGAHLHGWEGGKSLTVRKNDEVIKEFVTSKSLDDAYRYDTLHENSDILLSPGDVISLEAIYDNMTSKPLRGAMGELGVYIAEE